MRRLPAEWETQRCALLAWPLAETHWSDLVAARNEVFHLARTLARFQPVLLLVQPSDNTALRMRLVPEERRRITLVPVPLNDIWARDFGPLTLASDEGPLSLDFRFDGWGGKFPGQRDDAVVAALHAAGYLEGQRQAIDQVLEGGALDSDGAGTLLTTWRCLSARSDHGRAGWERRLGEWLGAKRVLWLENGCLDGDDTDGHVDILARFTDPGTIAYSAAPDRGHPDARALDALATELAGLRTAENTPYRLVPLPLPVPIQAHGRALPAGYANFLVINGAVLVPAYGDPADAVARERLAACFPRHTALSVPARALVTQGGALHCAVMTIPALVGNAMESTGK
ncbi:MAG: agmatine deiminase family protein [Gammaproteobacteria bacterium]|nr:agmatine deiminase family protein [Gammaproteobacteria bacterium]